MPTREPASERPLRPPRLRRGGPASSGTAKHGTRPRNPSPARDFGATSPGRVEVPPPVTIEVVTATTSARRIRATVRRGVPGPLPGRITSWPSTPRHHRRGELPRGPVRRRAGVRPLSRGLRRPRAVPQAAAGDRRPPAPGRRSQPADRNPIGYGMAAPTIVTLGTEAQKQRYLRPLFTCEEIWCQLFSEPGAGSDVASLSTRAIRDGEEWMVNGQKVWTTLAHVASFGMLLARSDPEAEKHKGLTYFVVDMHAPGVEVRPSAPDDRRRRVQRGVLHRRADPRLRASGRRRRGLERGDRHLDEREGLHRRCGGRSGIGTDRRGRRPLAQPSGLRTRPGTPGPAGELWVEAEVLRLTNIRAAVNSASGTPGPGGLHRQAGVRGAQPAHLRLRARPARARGDALRQLRDAPPGQRRAAGRVPAGCFSAPGPTRSRGHLGGHAQHPRGAGSRAAGRRRVDKGLPWSQVPRN